MANLVGHKEIFVLSPAFPELVVGTSLSFVLESILSTLLITQLRTECSKTFLGKPPYVHRPFEDNIWWNTVVVNLQLFFLLHHVCRQDLPHRPYADPSPIPSKNYKIFFVDLLLKKIALICSNVLMRIFHRSHEAPSQCIRHHGTLSAATVGFPEHSLPLSLHLYPLAVSCFYPLSVSRFLLLRCWCTT